MICPTVCTRCEFLLNGRCVRCEECGDPFCGACYEYHPCFDRFNEEQVDEQERESH